MREAWESSTIDECCTLINGGTPKTKTTEYWDGPHAWITPAEMGKRDSLYADDTRRSLSDAGLAKSSASILPPYSVIMSSRAPIGHLVVNTIPMATNQGCKGLIPNKNLHYKYLYYYLACNVELLNSLGTGATFKELSATKLKTVPVPLPPLPEQERIVSILDEAFAAIAIATTNAEKNLANARELFESYLSSVLQLVASSPPAHVLADITEFIVDCEHKTAPTQDSGYPSIRTPNIGKGHLVLDGVKRVSKFTYDEWTRRAIPKPGDLILAREAPAGNVGVIPESELVCLGQRTVLIRPDESVNSHYLASLLLHPLLQEQLLSHSTGATVQHVNMRDIRALKIPKLPPFEIQQEVVEQLKRVRIECEDLVATTMAKENILSELKQSILHKAFTGELTANPASIDRALSEAL